MVHSVGADWAQPRPAWNLGHPRPHRDPRPTRRMQALPCAIHFPHVGVSRLHGGLPWGPLTPCPSWRGSVPPFSFLMQQGSRLLPERSQGSSSPAGTCSPLRLSLRELTRAPRRRDFALTRVQELRWHWKVLTFYGFSAELLCSCSVMLFLDGVTLLRGSSGPQAPSSRWLFHLHVPPEVALGKVPSSWVILGVRLYAESRPFFGLNLPTFISSNVLLQIQAQSPFLGSVMSGWSPGLLPRLSDRVLFWVRKPPPRIGAGFTAQFFLSGTWLPASVVSNVLWVCFPVSLTRPSCCWQKERPSKGCGRPSWRGGCPEMPDAPLPGPSSSQTTELGTESERAWSSPGACRAQGLFLASSWGTTSPWLGVSDDCADWQVDRLEIWIRAECAVLSLKSIEQARQNGNLNKISRLQSLNSFFLFFMCNFTSVCWRGGRFSKEYTPAHKSTGRGNWEKRPSFSEVYNAEGHLQRDSERSKGEISALTVDPVLKLLVRAGPRACTQSL